MARTVTTLVLDVAVTRSRSTGWELMAAARAVATLVVVPASEKVPASAGEVVERIARSLQPCTSSSAPSVKVPHVMVAA